MCSDIILIWSWAGPYRAPWETKQDNAQNAFHSYLKNNAEPLELTELDIDFLSLLGVMDDFAQLFWKTWKLHSESTTWSAYIRG